MRARASESTEVLGGGFAAVAMLGDSGVDALVRVRPWPVAPSALVLGVTLVAAGLFQFSRLKRVCLTACRSPWAFLWQHYRRGVRGSWMLGVRHGVLCLGYCWALMLIMFGAGLGSLLWMLALTGFMIVEKTAPYGARLVAPLGGALVLAGVAVLAVLAVSASSSGAPAGDDSAVDPGMVALLVTAVGLALLRSTRKAGQQRLTGRRGSGGTRAGSDVRPRPHDGGGDPMLR